jgi:SAM-dependent methyltransferase
MKHAFAEPAIADLSPGSPEWFSAQSAIIRSRPLTKATYDLWYAKMLADAATVESMRPILEVGSGACYVKEVAPDVITSDVVSGPSDITVDGRSLPFDDGALRAIFLTHVFHHIPDVSEFLSEVDRVLEPGGVLCLIDVAKTPLARLIFGVFHPEPYDESAQEWLLSNPRGNMDANQALSWIVFQRDRLLFERKFPSLKIECIERLPWIGYLLSGGVTKRNFIPGAAASLVLAVQRALQFTNPICSLHWHIRIRKVARPA